MRCLVILITIAIAILVAHADSQQLASGDVAVAVQNTTSSGNWAAIFGIQPGGRVYTITYNLFRSPVAIVPAPDNKGVWVATNGRTGPGPVVMRVAADGAITTVQSVHLKTMNLNSSGEVIGTDGNGNRILSVSGQGVTTLAAGLPFTTVKDTAFDLKSGDLILGCADHIYRMSMRPPGKLTTVISFASAKSVVTWGLHADPTTGGILGSRYRRGSTPNAPVQEIFRMHLDPTPVVTTLWSTRFIGNTGPWGYSPGTGRFFLPAFNGSTWSTSILEFDPTTPAVSTLATFGGLGGGPFDIGMAVALAGSRYLTTTGPVQPGGTLGLLVQSPDEPGAPYAIALSFGFRPGIRTATGRKIHLNPDPLFLYSLTNTGIFSGFQGHLNTQGLSMGKMRIPAIPQLSGVRFFAAAITLAGNRISVISEPLGVTIQ